MGVPGRRRVRTEVVRYRLDVADPRVQVPPNCDLTLGMVCVDKSEPGTTVWQMPADERFTNPVGRLQGGFLAACCDSAMGAATVTWAKGRKVFSANAEMKVSFLARSAPGAAHLHVQGHLGRQPGGLRRGRADRRRGPSGGQGQLDLPPHPPCGERVASACGPSPGRGRMAPLRGGSVAA